MPVGELVAGLLCSVPEPVVRTGAYVLDPPFFGEGDVGRVAVCGVVNELAASGAEPRRLTLGIVLEAGLPMPLVRRLTDSVRHAADEAAVEIAAVDTRVVRAGEADRVFVTATALGVRHPGPPMDPRNIRPSDRLLVTGPLGSHAAHLLSLRHELGYEHLVPSDCAPLSGLLAQVLPHVRHARAVTEGGLARVLRSCAAGRGLTLRVDEVALPVQYEARIALGALGIDPLEAACAGCLCLFVPEERAAMVLSALHAHPYGRQAAVVGEVTADRTGEVQLRGADGEARPLGPPDAHAPVRLH